MTSPARHEKTDIPCALYQLGRWDRVFVSGIFWYSHKVNYAVQLHAQATTARLIVSYDDRLHKTLISESGSHVYVDSSKDENRKATPEEGCSTTSAPNRSLEVIVCHQDASLLHRESATSLSKT